MARGDEELLRLSETLRVLEDEREIIRLISSYGPAVDSGQSEVAAAIWTESGVYDTDSAAWRGRAEIAAMVEGAQHQQLIAEGAAHVVGVPHIQISGHRAVATCYSRVFRHVEGKFEVWRADRAARLRADRAELWRRRAGNWCARPRVGAPATAPTG